MLTILRYDFCLRSKNNCSSRRVVNFCEHWLRRWCLWTYSAFTNSVPSFPLQSSGFMSKLVPAIQNAHRNSTGSGRGKGLMVLTEPVLIETYTGLMSFTGNCNKLGYSLARGSVGFWHSFWGISTSSIATSLLKILFQPTIFLDWNN